MNNIQVLLIDDDDIVIMMHKKIICNSGLSTNPLCFTSAQKAIDYLESNHKPRNLNLILLDINMPDMNGWQFLDTIKQRPYAETIAVVFISSSIDNADKQKAILYGNVLDYIVKPLTVDLCKRIMALPQLEHYFLVPSNT